ncbi:MAG: xylosidase, partial [Bacteroidaceae bacterium]|nr:xylosidase [Bacteroidaceae bacterium]
MKKSIFVFAALCCVASAKSQTVEFFGPSIVHVVHTSQGSEPSVRKSEVVKQLPLYRDVKKSVAGGVTTYVTKELVVKVADGKVSFFDKKGNRLMNEEGSRFEPITVGPDKGLFRVAQSFSIDADEEVYGVGMLQNCKMSQRGENRLMIQTNLEDFAHFYQTIKGYGVFWDNYSPTQLNTPKSGEAGCLRLESQVADRVDYYFLYGGAKRNDGVISLMRTISGKAPMLPLWTYGFHQSRERYKSSHELLDVVSRYRRLGIPLDGIIQDWQYWGSNYLWNAMEFLNEDFQNAQQMIDSVHHMNAHISTSIWASFGPKTKPFRQLAEKDLLFSFETWPSSGLPYWPPRKDYPSGVRVYKPYTEEARAIYWDNLKRMFRMGIDGWWMDSTDPDHLDFKDSDLDETTPFEETGKQVSYRSVRNIFPLKTVEGVYNSQMKDAETGGQKDKARPFILTRSYFAGQQRTGANTWSGDVGSSWESFRKQIPLCLNYTLTANPQVNTDIGGFFAGSYNRGYLDNYGTRNPQYQELYARWMQFGVFCPMMRSHGTEVYRELYYYGENGIAGDIENPKGEIYNSLVGSVKLRYRLLPFIYSLSWQVSHNDDSFMRALFMDFAADKNTWNNNREFMFGHNILVCPVVDPLYTKEKIVKTDE